MLGEAPATETSAHNSANIERKALLLRLMTICTDWVVREGYCDSTNIAHKIVCINRYCQFRVIAVVVTNTAVTLLRLQRNQFCSSKKALATARASSNVSTKLDSEIPGSTSSASRFFSIFLETPIITQGLSYSPEISTS